MPTTRALTELFRAISAGDAKLASEIAARVCKSEEQKGHRAAARQLRAALASGNDSAASNGANTFERGPRSVAGGFLPAALVRLDNKSALTDVVLPKAVESELEGVIREWRLRNKLLARGVPPRGKLLFHGPPGCGKSLSARAVGNELGLPVYMVRFDAVIGAFLGQTAIHLRQLFHFAETTPCILLLDELDALGKKRGNPLDVGELDRIVIALMQELEHSKPAGLIIGTSNLPKHLDDALWRRFDLALAFPAPSSTLLRRYASLYAGAMNIKLSSSVLNRVVKQPSFALAEATIISEIRRQTLSDGSGD